jgi:hypothetical protein
LPGDCKIEFLKTKGNGAAWQIVTARFDTRHPRFEPWLAPLLGYGTSEDGRRSTCSVIAGRYQTSTGSGRPPHENGRIARHDNGRRVTDDELFTDDPKLEQDIDDYEPKPRCITGPEQHGVRAKMSATSGRVRVPPLQSELDEHKRVVECTKERRRPGQLTAVFAT